MKRRRGGCTVPRSGSMRERAASASSFAEVEQVDDGLEELCGGRAVDHAMVESQRQRHHRTARDFAAINRGLLDDPANAENSGLAGVQNRRERVDAVGAEIGDGESAAGNVFELEFSRARLLARIFAERRD